MGKASRVKRERRAAADFVTSLTACAGTWLDGPPSEQERRAVDSARRELMQHRAEIQALTADAEAANRFSLEVFRDARFAPLQFEDWVIEDVLDTFGEPPVVEDDDDPAFSNYLRDAVLHVASGKVRRAVVAQVLRFLPQYVQAGQIKEALAIEYNAYMTNMSDAVTPLLAQMMVGGLARYYDTVEEEEQAATTEEAAPAPAE